MERTVNQYTDAVRIARLEMAILDAMKHLMDFRNPTISRVFYDLSDAVNGMPKRDNTERARAEADAAF